MKPGCLEANKTSAIKVSETSKFLAKSMIVTDGWDETACIECKTGETEKYQTITFEGFRVIQTLDCKKSLIEKVPRPIIEKIEN